MNNYSANEAGTVLSPVEQIIEKSQDLLEVNKTDIIELAKKKLGESSNFQFFKGESTGNHYLIYLEEIPHTPVSVMELETQLGIGKRYNPKPIYQRPGGQHPIKVQKNILLDFLCGERVGNLVLFRKFGSLTFDLVDGRQRTGIIYDFIKDRIVLTGSHATKFWAYYLPYVIEANKQNHDKQLKLESNKLLNAIIKNVNTPSVKFSNLLSNIKTQIRSLTFDSKLINDVKFVNLETQTVISFDHPDYCVSKIDEMIRAKFNKLNLQQKQVQPIHTIWGSSCDYNIISRTYVERIPAIMSCLGYQVMDDQSDKDEEIIRTFNDLIVRSMLTFDKKLNWGLGLKKVSENMIDGVYEMDNTEKYNSKTFIEKFLSNRLGKVFEEPFVDNNGITRKVELAKELVGFGQKSVVQKMFILCLMDFYQYILENNKISKYVSGETPTPRMYYFVELLSKVLSVVTLRTVSSEYYSDPNRPIVKYELLTLYKNNEEVFQNLMNVASHSQKYSSLLKPTLREIVSIVDEFTL